VRAKPMKYDQMRRKAIKYDYDVSFASKSDQIRPIATKYDQMRANESTMRAESDQNASIRHISKLYVVHDILTVKHISGVATR
jgi:hypothetical protein